MSFTPYAPHPPGPSVRRRHPLRTVVIVLIIVVGLLVAADFAARAVAQGVMADQIKSHGFPKKPDVAIRGFPFLTQVAARDLHTVDIRSANVTEGPVTIKTINAVLTGVHINTSFHGGTVDRLAGTVLISFPEISRALTHEAGPLGSVIGGSGLTLQPAGPHAVRASAKLLIIRFSATWRLSVLPGNVIRARLISSHGVPSSLLSSVSSIKVPLPHLPLSLTVKNVEVTPGGLTGRLAGRSLSFGG